MSHIMPKAVALALACALTLPLAACGGDKTNQPSPDTTPVARGHTGAHPHPRGRPLRRGAHLLERGPAHPGLGPRPGGGAPVFPPRHRLS